MMAEVHAFRMQLKPRMAAEHRRRHDAIWPELAALLRAAGTHDYWIFLDAETGALFATLRAHPGSDRSQLPSHPVMRDWRDHMADIMAVEPDNKPKEWPLEPMFHLA